MGFFNFFKKSTPSQQSKPVESSEKAMPTVRADNRLHEIYAKTFIEEMKTIKAFNDSEIKQMLNIIQNADGGHLNQSTYHKKVFNEFFLGRVWNWPWYEKWDEKFKKFGSYPSNWPNCGAPRATPSHIEIVHTLNISQLKEAISFVGLDIPQKIKKKELQELAIDSKEVTNFIINSPVGRKILERSISPEKYDLYSVLMRTIGFWANSTLKSERCKELGLNEFRWINPHPDCIIYSEMAIAENKDARTPLYPGDLSLRRTILSFNDD